jgi:hypothetical protein
MDEGEHGCVGVYDVGIGSDRENSVGASTGGGGLDGVGESDGVALTIDLNGADEREASGDSLVWERTDSRVELVCGVCSI